MGNKTKTIIFDWGRTLHDPETDALFGGVSELLAELSAQHTLALVSLARSDSPQERRRKIERSGIAKYFKLILVSSEDKNELYEKALITLNVTPEEVVVVDDRMTRGIAWGNHRGATTMWLRKRKFSEELPTKETGSPAFTTGDITELKGLLMRLGKEV